MSLYKIHLSTGNKKIVTNIVMQKMNKLQIGNFKRINILENQEHMQTCNHHLKYKESLKRFSIKRDLEEKRGISEESIF